MKTLTRNLTSLLCLALMASSSPVRDVRAAVTPRLDDEVGPAMGHYPLPAILTPEMLPGIREDEAVQYNADTVLKDQPFDYAEYVIASYDGYPVTISAFFPNDSWSNSSRPWVYYIHAGGLVHGNRFYAIDYGFKLAKELGVVVFSVEYRLAPEHPAPSAIEDVYAGLVWLAENSNWLGINPGNALVWGSSAGGGLTAAVGLMARDRVPSKQLKIKGLLMHYPMIENNISKEERALFSGTSAPVWSAESDIMAWKAYLGDKPENANNPYLVPARAKDLTNLPPVFIDTGSAELFRQPVLKFAQALWEAGNLVELHVDAGAFHASDIMVPAAGVSQRAYSARCLWITRMLTH